MRLWRILVSRAPAAALLCSSSSHFRTSKASHNGVGALPNTLSFYCSFFAFFCPKKVRRSEDHKNTSKQRKKTRGPQKKQPKLRKTSQVKKKQLIRSNCLLASPRGFLRQRDETCRCQDHMGACQKPCIFLRFPRGRKKNIVLVKNAWGTSRFVPS